jgi:cell wall-associated NlpC family hydrolase
MNNYFRHERHQVELLKKIQGWLDVPYMHMGETKGGVDCTKLIGLILTELGVLKQIAKRAYYPKDWHINGSEQIVVSSFNSHQQYANHGYELESNIITLKNFVPLFGDIIGFAINEKAITNHVAWYIGGNQMFHCVPSQGCVKSQYNTFWSNRASHVFRVMEV